jgi:MSHA biogenesis protein MshQ
LINNTAGPNNLRAYLSGAGHVSAIAQNGAGFLIPNTSTLSLATFLGYNPESIISHIYTTPGSGIETVPYGAGNVSIYVWGPGGPGGSGSNAGFSYATNCGGSGGGGGYAVSQNVTCASAQTFTYNIGASGTPGANSTLGANGTIGTESNVIGSGVTTAIRAGAGGPGITFYHGGTGGVGGVANGGNYLNVTGISGNTGNAAVSGVSFGGSFGGSPNAFNVAPFYISADYNSGAYGGGSLTAGQDSGNYETTCGQHAGCGGAGAYSSNNTHVITFTQGAGAGANGAVWFVYSQ